MALADSPVRAAEASVVRLTDHDMYLFREGTHGRLYEKLGAHVERSDGTTQFSLWAPNAKAVSVIGEWNGWNADSDPLSARSDSSGVWEGRVTGALPGH